MQSKSYATMAVIRESYLDRGREGSKLTIPYLVLPSGHTHTSRLAQPWESSGAFLLNNLANKVMQSIFPVGLPWISLDLVAEIEEALEELPDAQREDILQQINTRLSQIEKVNFSRQVMKDGDPAVLARCIIQLLIQGNYCLQMLDSGKLKGRPLTHYTTERDAEGTVTKAVLEDTMAFEKLEEDVQKIVAQSRLGNAYPARYAMNMSMDDVAVYTHIKLNREGRYDVWQEVTGKTIPGSSVDYSMDDLPYIFAVFILLDGEDYGRGYVDNFHGDFTSLDAMSETVQRGTAAAAKLINFFRPGGVTRKDAFQRARTGDSITGVAADVTGYVSGKGSDFQASLQVQDRILNRLNTAFLWGVGNIRNAERVTAAEVQFLAQALEEQLGTSYTELVRTLQAPYARLKVRSMQRRGLLPSFSLDQVDISILTGASALTRQAKTQSLLQGLTFIKNLAPNSFEAKLDVDTLVNIVAEGDGYSYAGVMKSEEEVTTERREKMAEETLQQQLVAQSGAQAQAQAQQQQPQPPQGTPT